MKCRYFCRLPLDISPVYLTRGISLVLAPDYELIAANNGFIRKQSNVYVSKSKNGNQYLDSLGGGYDTGGYYVSGVFYFAS